MQQVKCGGGVGIGKVVEIGVSEFRLEKEFDTGRGGVEIGWFRVEGRDTGGDAETS